MDRIIIGSSKKVLELNFGNILTDWKPIYNGHNRLQFPVSIMNSGPFRFFNWGINSHLLIKEKGLLIDKRYQSLIRTRRCIIPCNAFSFSYKNERLLFISENYRLFALAGIYERGNFAVISQNTDNFFRRLDVFQKPVLLAPDQYNDYLNDLSHASAIIKSASTVQINAFPISNEINDIHKNDCQVLLPAGHKLIQPEIIYKNGKVPTSRKVKKNNSHWGDQATKKANKEEGEK